MRYAWALVILTIVPLTLAPTSTAGNAAPTHTQTVVHVPWDSTGDHTGIIEKAFDDAKAAGPGTIVELGEGTFVISRPILVADFDGTLRGAGEGKTIVQNKYVEGVGFGTLSSMGPISSLFTFYSTTSIARGGSADNPANISVSDITLRELGRGIRYAYHKDDQGNPIWEEIFDDFVRVAGRNVAGTKQGVPGFINVTFARIGVEGELNVTFPRHYNSSYGLMVAGWAEYFWTEVPGGYLLDDSLTVKSPITGALTWEDCSFSKLEAPIAVYEAENSKVRIRDIVAEDVFIVAVHAWNTTRSSLDIADLTVTNPSETIADYGGWDAVALWNTSDSTVNVSNLDVTNIAGVFVDNFEGDLQPSTLVFQHNTVNGLPGSSWAAFELWNELGVEGRALGSLIVTNNKINVIDQMPPYEAFFSYFVDNVQLTNNKITGSGVAAIWVEPFETPATGCALRANNLREFNAEFAGIYLGRGTTSCTVVGGDSRSSVFDEGTGNTVVGVNNQHGNSPGPALKAAMEAKRDAIKALTGR